MDLGLGGRRCLVTGASTGIGRGVALALAAEGARVAVAGRNAGLLEALAGEVAASGGIRPAVVLADLADDDGVERTLEQAVRALGAVDVLVNNAGGSRPLGGATAPAAVWDEAFALNFTAPRQLAEAVIPAMKAAGWGRIVNITGALAAKAVNAAGPAKAALLTWSRAAASELAPHGITVNCVAPGRIDSAQIRERLHPTEESRRAYIAENIPMGHFGEPADMGHLVAFLASPLAGYITAAHIPVDGGLYRMSLA